MEKGYALTVGQPAWSKMRHMELPPAKAALPDGTMMAGNVFERNIVAWRTRRPNCWRCETCRSNTTRSITIFTFISASRWRRA